MNKEYKGFIAPQITGDNHVFGGVSSINLPVIKVDGDWRKYRPIFESQLEQSFDSSGCTCYGTTNAIEALEKFLYNTTPNYSDRFVYNTVGITPPGSDPHLVATTIRGSGLVNEEDLPDLTPDLATFMTPRPLSVELRIKGQKWLNKQMLGHQWLWTTKPDAKTRVALLTEALTKGTVCISVSAWYKNEKGLFYSPPGSINGHWTHLEYIDETGMYVNDSYNEALTNTNLKKLTLDHDIQFAKVYFFTKPTEQQNWLVSLITALLELVGLRQKQIQNVVQPLPSVGEMPPYKWDTVANVRHSVRVICDEEGLTVEQKNTMCATIQAESEFNTHARNDNKVNGRVTSTDWGLCQWNSYWHGKEITPDEAVNNPEKAVRLMCSYWKANKRTLWVAYSTGRYKKYL